MALRSVEVNGKNHEMNVCVWLNQQATFQQNVGSFSCADRLFTGLAFVFIARRHSVNGARDLFLYLSFLLMKDYLMYLFYQSLCLHAHRRPGYSENSGYSGNHTCLPAV